MSERRFMRSPDRRRVPRGGRRGIDLAGKHPRILFADSDDSARRPCVRYLNLLGFQVDEAKTGDEAVFALHAYRPRIAITEVTLRGISRLTTTAVEDFHIPLIVTTTDAASPVPRKAAAVLVKPFRLSSMLDEVRRVLRLTERAAPQDLGV